MLGIFLFTALSFSARASEPAPVFPTTCQEKCVSAFGEKLGTTAEGVAAYSNCQPQCVFQKPSLVGETFAGIEWQCVEFARRWLLTKKGFTFDSIDVAADFWKKIDHLVEVSTKKTVPLASLANGADALPKIGDILVYGREFEDTGHMAIVLRINTGKKQIFVGEENFANKKWPGNYARTIDFVKHAGKFWLLDPYLLGWKAY